MATALTFPEVMNRLEDVRSDQIATIYLRRNPSAKALGVRYGDLEKLAKKTKHQTALAHELWETGLMEARTLAIRAIDPADVTPELADQWTREIDFPTLADEWAGVIHQTTFARQKLEEWTASPDEFVRRAGFSLAFRFAADPDSDICDERLLAFLNQIEREIHDSPNWAREMMNAVPVAIGKRSPSLYEPALAAARAYSPISVFHGDKTRCKVRNSFDDLQDPKVKVHA